MLIFGRVSSIVSRVNNRHAKRGSVVIKRYGYSTMTGISSKHYLVRSFFWRQWIATIKEMRQCVEPELVFRYHATRVCVNGHWSNITTSTITRSREDMERLSHINLTLVLLKKKKKGVGVKDKKVALHNGWTPFSCLHTLPRLTMPLLIHPCNFRMCRSLSCHINVIPLPSYRKLSKYCLHPLFVANSPAGRQQQRIVPISCAESPATPIQSCLRMSNISTSGKCIIILFWHKRISILQSLLSHSN